MYRQRAIDRNRAMPTAVVINAAVDHVVNKLLRYPVSPGQTIAVDEELLPARAPKKKARNGNLDLCVYPFLYARLVI